MSIQIGKFLQKKRKPSESFSKHHENEGYNKALTEASKVEIGLSRERLIGAIQSLGGDLQLAYIYKGQSGDPVADLADALIAAESELIVRKEGR